MYLCPGLDQGYRPAPLKVTQVPALRLQLRVHHPLAHQHEIREARPICTHRRAPSLLRSRGTEVRNSPAEQMGQVNDRSLEFCFGHPQVMSNTPSRPG
jgi:hypothetical protein